MKNKYAYKLEGYQDEWVETDAKNRVATYTNLHPGTYIFRVKGSNNDGVWNDQGTSLTIIIHKPWWGTTLAWFMYILMFAGAIGGFIRWRLSALKRKNWNWKMRSGNEPGKLKNRKKKFFPSGIWWNSKINKLSNSISSGPGSSPMYPMSSGRHLRLSRVRLKNCWMIRDAMKKNAEN